MFWSLERMSFFRNLNQDLQIQLQIFANQDLISKIEFFQVDISFASSLMTKITLMKSASDQIIYRVKDFFSNIYFILDGEVSEVDSKGVILHVYRAGEMFGHVDINSRFDRRFFAIGTCGKDVLGNLVQVAIEDFRFLLMKYPRVMRHFNQCVKK